MTENREPKNTRDLWLMAKTSTRGNWRGIVESARPEDSSKEITDGTVTNIMLRVQPQRHDDEIYVHVDEERATNVRKLGHAHYQYSTNIKVLWSHTYDFASFHESPFWEQTLEAWANRRNHDTSDLDNRSAYVDEWGGNLRVPLLRHRYDGLGNETLTGEIIDIGFEARTDAEEITLYKNADILFEGTPDELAECLRKAQAFDDIKMKIAELDFAELSNDELTISVPA